MQDLKKIQEEAKNACLRYGENNRKRLALIGDNRSTLKGVWVETDKTFEFKCFTGKLVIFKETKPNGVSGCFSMGANSDYSYSTFYHGCSIDDVKILMPYDAQLDRSPWTVPDFAKHIK